MRDIIGILLSFLYVFLFIGIADYLRKRGLLSPSLTRKVVHIGVAHWWLIAMATMESPWAASAGPVAFIFINLASLKFHLFKGMEEGQGPRNFGTVYFPISLLVLVLLSWNGIMPIWTAGTAVLVMGWGDGLAAIVGEAVPSLSGRVFGSRKSLAGSAAMALASALTVFMATLAFDGGAGVLMALYRAVGTALVAAFLEAATPLGIDNLTVPLGTAFYFAFLSPLGINAAVVAGFTLTSAVAYLAWQRRSVTAEGALAGIGLGTALFAAAGVRGLAVLFGFFVSSTLLGRIRRRRREALALSDVTAKGDRRDSIQVLANCGVGLLSAILYAATSEGLFFLAFAVSFAAATADTWAGEIGVLNPGSPVSILSLRPVAAGISGGVSLLGFLSSFLGALFIAAILAAERFYGGLALFPIASPGLGSLGLPFRPTLSLVVLGGFFGSIIDSLLGATVQAQYRCVRTGRITERPASEGKANALVRGFRWMTNDMVNFLSNLLAVLGSSWLYILWVGM